MLNWLTERASPFKHNPQTKLPGATVAATGLEEDMGYSPYRPDQGIVVQELSMEEFVRVYKQG